MISGGGVRLYIHSVSSAVASISIPLEGYIAFPTILSNIQSGVLAAADGSLACGNEHLSTEGLNCERLGSHFATLSSRHRHSVNTGRNRDAVGVRTVGPCPGASHVRVSGQNGGIVLANHIVASDGNSGRSRINRNGHRIGSDSGNTTLLVDSLSSDGVSTSLVEVDDQLSLVLTRNLNTVLVPDVTGSIARSVEDHLLSLANRGGVRSHNNLLRQLVHDDGNFTGSGTRTVGGVNSSSHMISGGGVRLYIHSVSSAVTSISIPLEGHIASPTILSSIERSVLAAADGSLACSNEHLSTEGLNCERLGSHFATLRSRHRHSVNTSRNCDAVGVRTGGPCPGASHVRVSSQNGGVILTNHIVTSDRNSGRSRINRDNNRLRSNSRDTAFLVDSLGSDGVSTSLVEVDDQLSLVLTRNLNTVLVPDVTGSIARSVEDHLLRLTNRSGVRSYNNLLRQLVHDNSDDTFFVTRTVGRSNSSGNMISRSGIRLYINRGRGAVASLSIPQVGDIASPAILISIQGGVLAAADGGSACGHEQVGTESLNCKRLGSHLTTLSGGHRNRVNTGRNRDSAVVRTSGPCPNTLNVRVSGQCCRVILANHIVTTDSNSGRSRINDDGAGHGGECRNTTGSRQRYNCGILVGGDVVGGGVHILAEGSLSSTLNQFTISEPSEDRTFCIGRIDGGSNGNLSAVTYGDGVLVVNRDVSHNRNRINRDGNLIEVEAQGRSLENSNTHRGGLCIVSSVSSRSSTRDVIMISGSIDIPDIITIGSITNSHGVLLLSNLIPLIGNVVSIVVIQVSSEGNLAVRTDLSLGSGDIHNRLLIDPNEELLRHRSTTGRNVISFNINLESVRLNASVEVLLIELVVAKVVSHIVSDLTRLIPSVVQITNIGTDGVNISN